MKRKEHSKKWKRVKEMIRRILGNNLKKGRYVIAQGMR